MKASRQSGKKGSLRQNWIKEGEEDITDLMDTSAAKKDMGEITLQVIRLSEGRDVAQWVECQVRRTADACSISWRGRGFFSQSQLSVQTLLMFTRSPCALTGINSCAHTKKSQALPTILLFGHTKIQPGPQSRTLKDEL